MKKDEKILKIVKIIKTVKKIKNEKMINEFNHLELACNNPHSLQAIE